jgi:hypothetical protein
MGTSKKAESTQLVIADQSVPNILSGLRAQLKELNKVTDSGYRTSGNIGELGVDIKSETGIGKLIKVHATLKTSADNYDASAAELGLDEYPAWSHGGCTLADWTADVKLRINIITHKERKEALENAIKEMEQFLTEEDRKAQVLAKIQKLMQ